MKKIIKISLIIGIITILLATGVKAAATIAANNISTSNGSTVQAELDKIKTKLATYCPEGSNCIQGRFAFGKPTTSSTTDFKSVISSRGSNVFVGLYKSQLSICIYRNSKLECFKNNNYEEESTHIKNVFGGGSCSSSSSKVECSDEDFYCRVSSSGNVNCRDDSSGRHCGVSSVGDVSCN